MCVQSIVACIISNVQERDDRWIALAADQLGNTTSVIRDYLEYGKDSVLLANLIHITNQIVNSSLRDDLTRHMADASLYILPALSNFDIRNTPRQLQDDFPSSWTEIAQDIQMEPHNHVLPGLAAACNSSTAP